MPVTKRLVLATHLNTQTHVHPLEEVLGTYSSAPWLFYGHLLVLYPLGLGLTRMNPMDVVTYRQQGTKG